MIWNAETRMIFAAWRERHITSGELIEVYSVTQLKPRQHHWGLLDRFIPPPDYSAPQGAVDRLTPSRG